jgi:hypothetical protein
MGPAAGVESATRRLGQYREHRRAAGAELDVLVAPLLPQIETGGRYGGEEDEPDRQQVELREQPQSQGR